MRNDINCIILCAGSGSRMKDESKNKVCFEVVGKPAVVRVIESLKKCGVSKFVVVVGNKAESVMKALADVDGVMFAYQPKQAGTGNAAKCGLDVLNAFGIDGPVLTVMGDKLIDKSVFQSLIDDFYEKGSDISLITQPADFNSTGGKIVVSNDRVMGIVEHMDLLLLKVCEKLRQGESREKALESLKLSPKQYDKISQKLELMGESAMEHFVEINGIRYNSDEILASGMVNCATYLHRRSAINESVYGLTSDNAQNEIYFTDTVSDISKNGTVSYVKIPQRKLIHTFNTMEELNAINDYFKGESFDD